MGLRFLLLLLAIVGVALIARHLMGTARRRPGALRAQGVPMARCARCGVHVPESEALRRGDDFFCSRKHLEAGQDDAH